MFAKRVKLAINNANTGKPVCSWLSYLFLLLFAAISADYSGLLSQNQSYSHEAVTTQAIQ